jgi:hypothetical protein
MGKKLQGLVLNDIITKPNYSNAIEVFLFSTEQDMYKAVDYWNEQRKNKYFLNYDFDALTVENLSNEIKKVGNEEYKIFATVFFNLKSLDYSIISHEFNHATFTFFREVLRFKGNFEKVRGTGDDEEEIFCYTQEGYIRSFLNLLKENNIEL